MVHYDVQNGDTLHLVQKVQQASDSSITVLIVTCTGKRISSLQVHPSHTVDNIKWLIQDKEGIPPDQQRLVFLDGKEIQQLMKKIRSVLIV